jgi:methionyl aminopeptidase
MKIKTYKSSEINSCREASKISATILDELNNLICVGLTTSEIDNYCLDRIKKLGGSPAPLFYRGFPKSTCTSLNRVICHGIPSANRKLEEGDILNVDVTTIIDGWHGDSSRMFKVGNISIKAQNLCKTTHSCLLESLNVIKVGNPISNIGKKLKK